MQIAIYALLGVIAVMATVTFVLNSKTRNLNRKLRELQERDRLQKGGGGR
jgi:hypothetical protein